jgi:hypothetical protein
MGQRIRPLHELVPHVMPFALSADGHKGPQVLIKGFALVNLNPHKGATERHG